MRRVGEMNAVAVFVSLMFGGGSGERVDELEPFAELLRA
jgi:hypothetical protein